ncbi:MAG: HAD-IB family hydrolase [Betaproteobacteria bacterium]
MKLVLFDLDNTLLDGDSDYEWAQFLITKGVLDREIYERRNEEFYKAYVAGVLDIEEFLDFQLKPLGQHKRSQLDLWHSEFMSQKVRPMITQGARDLVQKYHSDLVAIVTATNSFITKPIAEEFGIENLIATEPEQFDGEFTGGVVGLPSFREGKVTRVHEWLRSIGRTWESFDETIFFSDSINDLPLLNEVSVPVVVDPDINLLQHAKSVGWEVLSLRDEP